jgi:hypothetical protein
MGEEMSYDRRRFLGTAAMAVAATRFGNFAGIEARATKKDPAFTAPGRSSANPPFGPMVSVWSSVRVAREQAVDERECRAEWMIRMPLRHMAEPAA